MTSLAGHSPLAVPLGEVCSMLNGGTPSKEVQSYWNGKIPWITSADIQSSRVLTARNYVTEMGLKHSATSLVKSGTILLVTRTSVGKVAVNAMDLCFSQDITALSPDPRRLDSSYLVHFLRTQEAYFERMARGATIKGITREVIERILVPLPPLSEQRRITAILDQADALRAKRQAALERLHSLKQAIFADMFGRSMNRDSWAKVKLGNIARRITKGESPNWQGFAYQTEGVRFITSEDVGWGKLEPKPPKYISSEFNNKLKRSQVLENDILANLVGASIGRCCIAPPGAIPANVNQAVAVVTLDHERAVPEFVLQQLLTPYQQSVLLGHRVEAARANISLANLRELGLILPPMEIQQKFKRLMCGIERTTLVEKSSLRALEVIICSVQNRAFRGEL